MLPANGCQGIRDVDSVASVKRIKVVRVATKIVDRNCHASISSASSQTRLLSRAPLAHSFYLSLFDSVTPATLSHLIESCAKSPRTSVIVSAANKTRRAAVQMFRFTLVPKGDKKCQ